MPHSGVLLAGDGLGAVNSQQLTTTHNIPPNEAGSHEQIRRARVVSFVVSFSRFLAIFGVWGYNTDAQNIA
jgi:hypothetical protein